MRFSPRQLACPFALAAFLACAINPAGAQGPVVVRAGSGTNAQVAPSGTLAVPFSVDRTAAQNTTVSNISLQVLFDQTRLSFDSAQFSGFLSDYSGGRSGTPLNLFMAGQTTGAITPAGVL